MKAVMKKLKNRIGTSMVEMLATVVLLGIMGVALTAGVSTIQRTYSQIVRKANEQTLLSTTLIEMRNAIRRSVDYNSDSERFKSIDGYWFKFREANDAVDTEKGIQVDYYTSENVDEDHVETRPLVSNKDGEISNVYSIFESITEVSDGLYVIKGLKVGNEDTGWTTLMKDSDEYYVKQIAKE